MGGRLPVATSKIRTLLCKMRAQQQKHLLLEFGVSGCCSCLPVGGPSRTSFSAPPAEGTTATGPDVQFNSSWQTCGSARSARIRRRRRRTTPRYRYPCPINIFRKIDRIAVPEPYRSTQFWKRANSTIFSIPGAIPLTEKAAAANSKATVSLGWRLSSEGGDRLEAELYSN
jgi:hypothetical protein